MRKIHVSKLEVLENLKRLSQGLSINRKGQWVVQGGFRTYPVLINLDTGIIQFAEQPEVIRKEWSKNQSEEWREIQLLVEQSESKLLYRFVDPDGAPLQTPDFKPLAVLILLETLEVLTLLSRLYKNSSHFLPEKNALSHLSDVEYSSKVKSIESYKEWVGSINRTEAERELEGKPKGTFLLRSPDDVIDAVAKALTDVNEVPVRLYILSYVEEEGKVSEQLLIQTQWGWTIAKDQPNLMNLSYEYRSSIEALLQSLSYIKHCYANSE